LALLLAGNQAVVGARWELWETERKDGQDLRDLHKFINVAAEKPDMLLSLYRYYSHQETGLPCLWYPEQWPYAVEHGLLADKRRVWAVLFSGPGTPGEFDPGGPYRLGTTPLYAAGNFSIYEVLPRESESPPTSSIGSGDRPPVSPP
jgi:hypothetical protein